MTVQHPITDPETGYTDDELLRLQKLTAQRADKLRREQKNSSSGDLAIWLTAEDEILRSYRYSDSTNRG